MGRLAEQAVGRAGRLLGQYLRVEEDGHVRLDLRSFLGLGEAQVQGGAALRAAAPLGTRPPPC
jgi:hypothetical protein